MSYRRRLLLLGILALVCLSGGVSIQLFQEYRALQHEDLVKRAEENLQRLTQHLDATLEALAPRLEGIRFNERAFASELHSTAQPEMAIFMLYEAGQLRYWSDNKVQPDYAEMNAFESGRVYLLGNGYYLISKVSSGNRLLAGLLLVRHHYVLQNKYLENDFHPGLELDGETQLSLSAASGSLPLKNKAGKVLFNLSFPANDTSQNCPFYAALLYGGCIFFIFLLALDTLRRLGRSRARSGLVWLLALVTLRVLMAWLQYPQQIYESELFSSKYYASGFLLNSLGDLLLSSAVLTLIIIFVYSWLLQGRDFSDSWSSRLLIVAVFFVTFLFSVLMNYLLSGLIINSQISFDINNIFELSIYTAIGMVVIGLLLGTFYLLCDGSILFIRKTRLPFSRIAILFLISQGLFLCTLLLFRNTGLFADYGVSAFLLANVLMLFIGYIRSSELQLYSFSRTVLVILVFSIYASQIIYSFNETREREKRQLLAAKLENEQDIVAEFLLQGLEPRIRNDRELIRLLTLPSALVMSNPVLIDNVNRHLARQYFNGYLERYEVHFKYFNATDLPINRAGDPSWNLDNIRHRNLNEGRPTFSRSFYYFRDDNGKAQYNGELRPGANDAPVGTLIVELSARTSQEELGLPELLLSDKVGSTRDISHYAYARYQQGRLVNQSGPYNYYLTDGPYLQYFRNLEGMRFVSFDNHLHLFYKYDRNLIILSTPRQGLWVWVTLFSYLFTFFSFVFLVTSLAARFVREGFRLQLNFNSRIQLTIVMIVVGTLVLIGAATVTYIVDNYEQAQTKRIREKLNNIRVLVENEMGNRNDLGRQLSDDLQYLFSRLAGTLKTDFNFYNPEGKLYFSSQQSIYEQGILGPLMNRDALTSLTTNQKAFYIQSENIGRLKYTAAYEPVRNSSNQSIGFISLPYFDRDTELKRDISGFLVALINLYVLLFSVSILIAFFISNRITQPLRIIQDSLSRTKLGETNEPIVWKTRDEIGALINEYNRMLDQIQKSAAILARSERESAWREMAKQVAHEIKNPLTPMKLGIQHLQRAIAADHPNKEELVQKISNTMIEQIDTLSNIATEFSHFAKMPRPEYTRVELISVLNHTCDLYNEDGKALVSFESHPDELYVQADKDQLIRIFGNLIKNAQQAIPDHREGHIRIRVEESEKQVKISIRDNGIGIPKDQLPKIFVPNFTTKSSGTGLGLAMVKAMVEGMGGHVWFDTLENQGTTFYVNLNKN
ncbi:MAG: HAMP domain-containing histidine kinase [Bacteroidia bacterium]|nr:HAMP domain-containing histidine kinase [Bacteroidia bacterium]